MKNDKLTINGIELHMEHIRNFLKNDFIQIHAITEIIDRFRYAYSTVQLEYYGFNNISKEMQEQYNSEIIELKKQFDKKYKAELKTEKDNW